MSLHHIEQTEKLLLGSLQTFSTQFKFLKETEEELNTKKEKLETIEKSLQEREQTLIQHSLNINGGNSTKNIIPYECQQNDIVKLNIGGTEFSTTRQTLTIDKTAIFNTLLKSDNNTAVYFLDRDPKYFPLILNHLRRNNIAIQLSEMSRGELSEFIQEVLFYSISSILRILPTKGLKLLHDEFHVILEGLKINAFEFDPKYINNTNLVLSKDCKRIKKVKGSNDWQSGALGTIGCYRYKIKLINSCHNLMVGFMSTSRFEPSTPNNRSGWFVCIQTGKIYSAEDPPLGSNYTTLFNGNNYPGSTVEAIYDDYANTISFKINGKDCGVAFKNVSVYNGDIRPAFDICYLETEFEFVD
ncbi:hypothetical protein ABK040_004464 [Willaertia magna]